MAGVNCGETQGAQWTDVRTGLERETGFEPATACLEGRYSTSLSYSRSTVPILSVGQETVKRRTRGVGRPVVDSSLAVYRLCDFRASTPCWDCGLSGIVSPAAMNGVTLA